VYHLNEGHTGFAALGLIGSKMDDGMAFEDAVLWVKEHTVSSKHTVFSESGLHVRSGELIAHIKAYCEKHKIDVNRIFSIGIHELDSDTFSTTGFMVNLSRKSNGVSIIHTVFEKDVHKKSILIPITNGVYKPRWKSKLWTEGSGILSDNNVWDIKKKLRTTLLDYVKKETGVVMDPDACTIVWARRFAAYKRPSLLFSDIARLGRICSASNMPVQFIISGKAHESDQEGQKLVSLIKGLTEDPVFKGKVVYIPDYSLETAALLVAGADVWLNTPIRGKEASGTSGMKAGLNGTLQVSISDGWMDEVDWTGTGWILPDEGTGEALYSILESEIVPLFFNRPKNSIPEEWIRRMRGTMNIVETRFGAERMLRDYIRQLYEIQ
jgi:alpha-glucan phosphorylase-like protein